MKKCSTCQRFKPYDHFRKNRCTKDGFQNVCKPCHLEMGNAWKKANPEKVSQHNKTSYYKDVEKSRARVKAYREENPAIISAQNQARYDSIVERTPKWLTEGDWIEMNWAYNIAKAKTAATGVDYEVDHIIPLRGKIVSGLNVPWNLQMITKRENASKGNRFGGTV